MLTFFHCAFQMILQTLCLRRGIIGWLHLFEFSPLCVLYVASNDFYNRTHSRICCICLTFLRCVFSYASSNCLPEKMQSHIGCICLTFRHCAFSNESSNCLPEKRHSRIGCIGHFSTVHFLYVASNGHYKSIHSHIGCICFTFLHCAFS